MARQYNRHGNWSHRPYAAGIRTGSLHTGGFAALTGAVQECVDSDISEINDLLQGRDYQRVVYSRSSNGGSPSIGAGIFIVDGSVTAYITEQILNNLRNRSNDLQIVSSVFVGEGAPGDFEHDITNQITRDSDRGFFA